MPREHLGEVTVPSGILTLCDPEHTGEGPAVRVDGMPRDRALAIVGERMTEGDWAGSWDHVAIEVMPGTIVHAEPHGEIAVDRAQLLIADDGVRTGYLLATSWGDGVFPVFCDRDDDDRLIQVRIQFHTDASDAAIPI